MDNPAAGTAPAKTYDYYLSYVTDYGKTVAVNVRRTQPIASVADVTDVQNWIRETYDPTALVVAFSRYDA